MTQAMKTVATLAGLASLFAYVITFRSDLYELFSGRADGWLVAMPAALILASILTALTSALTGVVLAIAGVMIMVLAALSGEGGWIALVLAIVTIAVQAGVALREADQALL